jgi:hypothetical protein
MVCMVFARVPEELLGVEVSDRSQRQSRLESLTKAVWTLIELCLTRASVDIEAKSEPVGVQESLGYSKRRRVRRIRLGAVRPKAADAPRAIVRPLSCAASEAVG